MTTLTGTGRLVRLALRRDRWRLPLWIGVIVAFVVVSAVSVESLYATRQDLLEYVELMSGNPTLTAVNGPGYGFDDPNIGVVFVNETTVWAALAAALMSVFLVNRHTRAEEESDRTELLRASVVGRHAPITAAIVVVAAADLLVAVGVAVSLLVIGYPATGSVAMAASVAAVGFVFIGLTALAAQVTSSGRMVLGASVGVLGLAYALRAAGDMGDGTLSWASPLGWAHAVRAYAGERWWVLGLALAVSAGLVRGALALLDHRDLGGGLVGERAGRPHAPAWLRRPPGLAWRLQRGALAGWAGGVFLLGVVYGAVGQDIEEMFEDNPDLADFIEQLEGASLTDSFFAYTLVLGAMLTAGFAIASALRLRSEESAGRAEPLLAGPLARSRWAAGHLAVAAGGTVAVLVASGLGTGLGLAVAVGDAGQVARMTGASLVHAPAVLVLVGVAVALFGLRPRWSPLAWAALAAVVVVGLFGEPFRFPHVVRLVSPFEHTPAAPAEDVRLLPLVVLTALAAGLVAVGLRGFRERDLAGP